MAESELGMKARGVCLAPLLDYGIPGSETADSMIQEIDTQLSENQSRLQECVLELMELSQNLSGVSEKFMNPTAALTHITENRLMDKQMCFDPDSEAIVKLLRTVLHLMEKNPGCEEKVLHQLYKVCSAEGVSIPYRPSGSNPQNQSVVSLNTAVDASEQITEKLWNDIVVKMKQYYSEQLKGLPFGEKKAVLCYNEDRAIRCVQALCSLMSAERTWSLYCSIRAQQLTTCMKRCVANVAKSKKSPSSISMAADQFTALVGSISNMMDDDFELFNSNAFSNVITPMSALSEIYSEPLLNEISKITGKLFEELGGYPMVKSPKGEKRKVSHEDKEMSKSPSDVGFLGHLKVGIMKPQSKSADNLLDQEEQQFSDLQVLPQGFLEPITRLVDQLLILECHMDKLHNAMMWQAMANATLKAKNKSSLKGVLKASTANHSEDSKKQAFSPRSFEKSGMLPEAIPPPFGATQAMIAQLSASLRVVEKPYEDRMNFNWRRCFGKLASDLARSVQHHINMQAGQTLREMQDYIIKHNQIETASVQHDLVGGRLDYPVKVAKSIQSLLAEINDVLPLARAGPDGPFGIIRAGFIEATSVSLKNINQKLTALCTDSDVKLPQKCQYVVLGTLSFVRNQILTYEHALGTEENGGKKAFPTLYRQYCEAVDDLSRQIIEAHNSVIMSSILHDAESHYWDDSKDFYEGERCSFSIQMWYSHLMALRSDLWTTCPPKLSQTMFSAVLQESLSVLCQRYVRVKPSYRRTHQFRGDITAILLCTSELLYYATSSILKYLDPTNAQSEHYNIHINCAMLLASLVLVSAPIDSVYKIYRKGFKKKRSHSDEDSTKGYVSHWLSWIRPHVFPLGKTNPEGLQTTSALFVQLNLLYSKPDTNWILLLQSLLMKEYTLPIMLLSRVAMQHASENSNHSSPEHAPQANHRISHNANAKEPNTITQEPSTRTHEPSTKTQEPNTRTHSASNDDDVKKIFTVFVRVLIQCSEFPAALTKVMIPVLDRSDSWDVFDVNFTVTKPEQVPPWVASVMDCLESYVIRAITPGIRVILMRNHEPVGTEPITLRLKELPCGCPASQEAPLGNKVLSSTTDVVASVMQNNSKLSGSKDILAEALYSTITQLVSDVYTVPTPIVMLFKAAQRHAAEKGIQSPHNSLAVKVLAISLKLQLSDIAYIQALVGEPLDVSVCEQIKMLSECVYHVLTAASYGKGSGTPRLAGMFMKANRNWVSDQIDVLVEHFNNQIFDLPIGHPLDDVTVEFAENLLISQASALLSLDKGEESLCSVYNMIVNNRSWILTQLDIPPLLGSHDNPRPVSIVHSLDPPAPQLYNPLQAYRKLGDTHFDQAAIMTFPWDWSAMMSSDLGLSQVGFRELLFNRHEMQDGAYLEENEKKPVESLRRKFHADSPEL